MNNELGEFIKLRRGNKSLRDFADEIGISHSYLDNIEKGIDSKTKKKVNITTDLLFKLSTILNVDELIMIYLMNDNFYDNYLELYNSFSEEGKNLINSVDKNNKENIGKIIFFTLFKQNLTDDEIVYLLSTREPFKNLKSNEIKQFIKHLNLKLPEKIVIDKTDTLSKEEKELAMLKDVLKRKGFLNDNEELSEENFNMLIAFAKANKQFIMKDKDKE